jgi:O-antigen/teichoic acid export membrane protein
MSNFSRTLLKGVAVLSLGQAVGYGLSFVRNMILARLLTKADFGLAAALSLTMSLLEMVSQLGLNKQIVQAREGEDLKFQEVAQTVQISTGVFSAILIIILAYPMALAFGVPGLTWAFGSLALIPIARGLMHLDVTRVQRYYNYNPTVLIEIVPQVLATAAAWPLVIFLNDFRAVLVIMLGREILIVIMSHLLAKRKYRWSWELNYIKQMMVFGWPLLLNGLMIFACQQGDQMIVGAVFSLSQLASYSIAFTLSSIPFFIFGQVSSSIMLPTLAHHQDDFEKFKSYYRKSLEVSVFCSMIILSPLFVAGDPLVRFLYGPKYSGIGTLMAIFGIIMALRFFRWASAVAAMSHADTINQFLGNSARALGLLLALLFVAMGSRNILAVAGCGIIGEVAAILVSILRLCKRQKIQIEVHKNPVFFLAGWVLTSLVINWYLGNGASLWQVGGAVLILWSAGALSAVFLFPELVLLFRNVIISLRPSAIVARS